MAGLHIPRVEFRSETDPKCAHYFIAKFQFLCVCVLAGEHFEMCVCVCGGEGRKTKRSAELLRGRRRLNVCWRIVKLSARMTERYVCFVRSVLYVCAFVVWHDTHTLAHQQKITHGMMLYLFDGYC